MNLKISKFKDKSGWHRVVEDEVVEVKVKDYKKKVKKISEVTK